MTKEMSSVMKPTKTALAFIVTLIVAAPASAVNCVSSPASAARRPSVRQGSRRAHVVPLLLHCCSVHRCWRDFVMAEARRSAPGAGSTQFRSLNFTGTRPGR